MKKINEEKRKLYLVKLKKYEKELLKKLYSKKQDGRSVE